MSKIGNQPGSPKVGQTNNQSGQETKKVKTGFGKAMDKVGKAALSTVSAVAPNVPGGELVKMAADGLKGLSDQTPSELTAQAGSGDFSNRMEKMQEMQEQNQVQNMQYFQLQQEAQADNRKFKTMSNLMKTRHDTAKSAINNMRA